MSVSKINRVTDIIRAHPKAVVAFSGGVDSTLLLKLCRDILGPRNVIAVTGVSQTYTAEEKATARRMAKRLGVRHVLLETDELAREDFTANPADRCYYCKRELFAGISGLARAEGIAAVLDATNADDLADYRPGRRATEECGVISPLVAAGFTKKDVRALSKKLGLESWDKPANPCLASRIPYGTRITEDVLEKIRAGEKFIRESGFPVVRLRHHGPLARVEIPAADFARFLKPATARKIVARLKSLGYLWIAVDVEGYKMGSLNRSIGKPAPERP